MICTKKLEIMGYDNTSMVYLTISLSDPLRSMQAQIFADHLTLAQPGGGADDAL